MKRNNRKSLSQTPVQKTTLLNYFQRTPSTGSHQATPLARNNNTLLNYVDKTPSTAVSKPNLVNLASATPSTSRVSKILETPTTRTADPTKTVICPGCEKSVPLYRLNDHLDLECVVSSQATPSYPIKNPISDSVIEPIKIDFNSPSNTPPRTPKHQQLYPKRKIFSSSKKNSIRKRLIADDFKPRQFETDVKKLSESTSNSDASTIRKKLFADVPAVKKKYAMPYYLETFLFLLKSTFEEPLHQHLFIPEEHQLYQTFQSLSMDGKKLYVRLFTRKFQWRRREKVVYQDIADDLSPALLELCQSSLLLDIENLDDLPTLLKMLNQPELKVIFKEVKLPFSSKGNAIEALMKHCKNQPCLTGSSQSMTERLTSKIKRQYLKECYKLNEEPRRTFLRLLMLSTLHHRQEEEEEKGQQQQSLTMLKVIIGQQKYPDYPRRRQRAIFKQREHFISYGEASLLELQVREPFDNKQWQTVLDLTNPIHQDGLFSKHREMYGKDDLELPLFLRRFTAGSVYMSLCNKRIEALQCLKLYQEAVDLLKMLIDQDVYLLTHRGHWYDRIALNLETHLKDQKKALEMIKNGLKDSWVSPSHKWALSQRMEKLAKRLKLDALLCEMPLLTAAEPKCVTITGRSLPRDLPGVKSMFIRGDCNVNMDGGDVTLCSVEELALQHYKDNGYTDGLHGEGSTLWTVVGLLFWDIIYQSDVPDVFLSPFQAMPLDFDSLDFYQSRKDIIEERLDTLRRWSTDELVKWIADIWNENHGQTSLVLWERFSSVEHVKGLVRCIPHDTLAAISQRLLQNYRHFRSGFPDLTIWNSEEKKWRIVEVKGPNDRLSPKQTLWLDFLVSLGVKAEVCHVQAVGAKRMGATPHQGNVTKRRSIESQDTDGAELVGATPHTTSKVIKKKTTGKSQKQESISKSRRNLRKSNEEEESEAIIVRRSRRLKFESTVDDDSDFVT